MGRYLAGCYLDKNQKLGVWASAVLVSWILLVAPVLAAPEVSKDLLRQEGEQFERTHQWAKALEIYADLLAKDKNGSEIRDRYQICLRHLQQIRRHQDKAFRESVLNHDLKVAVKLYGEVAAKLKTNYLEKDFTTLNRLFQKALHVAKTYGWTRFVSMQDHLNLIYREEEREMLPLCREEKVGVIPYSPLASGRLTRDWSSESTLRSETDQIAKTKYDATADTDRQVVERVAELADKHEVPRVHIALAWLLQKEPVTAPIIGATKISHLEEAVGALSIKLTQEDVAYLEEPYVPHRIVGHQ